MYNKGDGGKLRAVMLFCCVGCWNEVAHRHSLLVTVGRHPRLTDRPVDVFMDTVFYEVCTGHTLVKATLLKISLVLRTFLFVGP